MKTPHVVIVGGGFGGLAAAKNLAKNGQLQVTLVDKKNYHLFQPLLYQVAMAGLSPAEIAYPLRALLSQYENAEILLGEVKEINKEEKWIRTPTNKIHFDYLILACGSTYTYFNAPQFEPFAPGLKTISQATEIRRRVFMAFERAERSEDLREQNFNLTFVVVGGGPTGVELAGSLGEITRYTLRKEFNHIESTQAKIILLEAGPTILPSFTPKLRRKAQKQLEELGVEVRVNQLVSQIDELGITAGGNFISAATVLWAAGVAANPLNKTLQTELDHKGRVMVQPDLSIPHFPDIFVIGDQAYLEWGKDKQALPGLAPVAMQQGRYLAKLIKHRTLDHRPPGPFKYIDKGQMATIGRSRAVALFKGLEISGFSAWMTWLLIHIYYLSGFKNRVFVMIQWIWTYLTFRRGARLIVEKEG